MCVCVCVCVMRFERGGRKRLKKSVSDLMCVSYLLAGAINVAKQAGKTEEPVLNE